jgi:hypothetical protein
LLVIVRRCGETLLGWVASHACGELSGGDVSGEKLGESVAVAVR